MKLRSSEDNTKRIRELYKKYYINDLIKIFRRLYENTSTFYRLYWSRFDKKCPLFCKRGPGDKNNIFIYKVNIFLHWVVRDPKDTISTPGQPELK